MSFNFLRVYADHSGETHLARMVLPKTIEAHVDGPQKASIMNVPATTLHVSQRLDTSGGFPGSPSSSAKTDRDRLAWCIRDHDNQRGPPPVPRRGLPPSGRCRQPRPYLRRCRRDPLGHPRCRYRQRLAARRSPIGSAAGALSAGDVVHRGPNFRMRYLGAKVVQLTMVAS